MATIRLTPNKSLVLAVDIQSVFSSAIFEFDRMLARSEFLLKAAALMGVPVISTVQNPNKLGPVRPEIVANGPDPLPKLSFSCWADPEIRSAISASNADQVVIVGIETHICVSLTAQDLLSEGFEVVVCPDAVSAGTQDRHKLGMERIRDGGAVPIHSEAIAYEWIGTASDARFGQLLKIVKEHRSH